MFDLEQLASIPILQKFMVGLVVLLPLLYLLPRSIAGIVVVGLLVAGLAIWFMNKGLKGVKKAKASAFDRGLSADANKPTKGKAENRKAVSELADRWNKAITELKSAGLSLYDLPWYMLIGEPQSGKSTTLKQSGLEFPVGTDALSGAGGTRNCDWWFTNDAIILDTAGRFTFQEKSAPDAEEWNGFLRLLKKNRPACPINGVIVTVPCTSLLSDEPEQREEKARNIREKLTQIQRELGVQFPVFILITKSDQILGFTEFFSRLGATEQRQLVGWSMPGNFIQAYNPDTFNELFPKMYDRIHKWRMKLLGEDLSLTDVDKMYVFPEEFLALREPLYDYLKAIFVKTQLLKPLFFRGFYFTSGLQQGKPVAKACAAMIRNAGAGAEEIVEHLQKIFERSRAFFIRDFYLEKLFPERALVIHSEGKLNRDRTMGKLAVWASALLLVLTVGFVGWRAWVMRQGIGAIDEVAAQIHQGFSDENSRLKKGDESPLGVEEATSYVKKASDFERFSKDTSAKLPGLATPLRDMYWIYYIQNVVEEQGRLLYDKLAKTRPGASMDDAAVKKDYAQYAKLWSVNAAWLDHETGRSGFDLAEAIQLPPMAETGVSADTEKQFQSGLDRLRSIMKEDLDFKSQPAALPLARGDLRPPQNPVISKEVDFINQSFKPVDAASVQTIVGAAKSLRDAYGQSIGPVLGVPCGYPDPQTDPFSTARSAMATIRDAFKGLDDKMNSNQGLLRSMASDPASVQKAFDALDWKNAAVDGAAKMALNDYIHSQAMQIAQRMKGEAEDAKRPLQEVTDVVITSGSLVRGPALAIVEDGFTHLEGLANAQDDAVKKLAAANDIHNADQAKQAADLWAQNKARQEAKAWGDTYASRSDLPAAWQVPQLAQAMQRMVRDGDESVRVEAWLAYARNEMPGALLSRNQISEASLSSEPPTGAQPEAVARAIERLTALGEALNKFKGEVTCDRSLARLNSRIGDVASMKKSNQDNFLAYWKTGYGNWRPESWISGIPTWQAFKSDPLMQGTVLSSRIKGDLSRFVTNVQGFKDKVGSVGELSTTLNDLNAFVTAGSALEQNANTFSDTIASLDPDKLTARVQLDQPGPGGQPRSRGIEAIATRSSSLNEKFVYFPQKVLSLVGGAKEFEIELGRFFTQWSGKLGGKFPFAVEPGAIKIAGDEINIPQATAAQLKDFYYGSDSLPAFLGKYRALFDEWAKDPDHAPAATFVNQCLDLRGFFFADPARGDYKPLHLEGTYTGFDGKRTEDLAAISEQLDLSIPSAAPSLAHARWRSQTPGGKFAFDWQPGDYGDKGKMVFKSSLERGDNPNTAQITVGGDFSLLAYIVTQSRGSEVDGRRWTSKFGVTTANKQQYMVNYVFELDRGLPHLPDWATVRRFEKAGTN